MSKNPLLWKFLVIIAVVALTVLFGYPPKDKINLGLDLRGGAHILLRVKTETAVENEMKRQQTYLGRAFEDAGLTYSSIVATSETRLEVRGTDPARNSEIRDVLDDWRLGWDIGSAAGGTWRLTLQPQLRAQVTANAVKTTLNVLRNRIDQFGVTEPIISEQGMTGDRILIQMPGVEDPERIKELLKRQALLEWKITTYPPQITDPRTWGPSNSREELARLFGGQLPDDTDAYPQKVLSGDGMVEVWWPLKRVSTLTGDDLRTAGRSTNRWNQPIVTFELTAEAGARFFTATTNNVGRHMPILIDGKIVSAPTIKSPIRNSGLIEGSFDIAGAEDLALTLRSGATPVGTEIIEERTVGPSLGRDSIRAGLTAGIAGFLGVIVFMLIYYRLSGINAAVALALNLLLVFGVLGALPVLFTGVQATLTLPGIAGLILTVGMAVDANVLIFERIREELNLGKTVRSAVEQGFGKAFMTILDCNVTTLVAAFFLFSYGTGPVKGFAVTLTIGLLASMFTAVFVSRQLFELVLLSKGQRAESLSI